MAFVAELLEERPRHLLRLAPSNNGEHIALIADDRHIMAALNRLVTDRRYIPWQTGIELIHRERRHLKADANRTKKLDRPFNVVGVMRIDGRCRIEFLAEESRADEVLLHVGFDAAVVRARVAGIIAS